MKKYTPGKLTLAKISSFIVQSEAKAPDGRVRLMLNVNGFCEHQGEAAANAKRLVECWNAMVGIDDPAAARAVLDDPQTQHANDLLTALRNLTSGEVSQSARKRYWEEAREVIARIDRRNDLRCAECHSEFIGDGILSSGAKKPLPVKCPKCGQQLIDIKTNKPATF